MTRYDQDWVDALVAGAGPVEGLDGGLRVLFVVTDTADGKAAFYLDLADGVVESATPGRLPRGEKADITVTAKEATLLEIWRGERTYDAGFMSGDLKIEGAYEEWLDRVTPAFAVAPWSEAWSEAAA